MRQSLWEKLVIEQLRDIELKKSAYCNVLGRIQRLKDESGKVKGTVLSTTPVMGGQLNKEEERRLNNLSLCEELSTNARKLKKEINLFNQAWEQLDKNDQLVLTYFYINRSRDYIDRLMQILNYEKRKVYYLKDEALYKLTLLIYGSK